MIRDSGLLFGPPCMFKHDASVHCCTNI